MLQKRWTPKETNHNYTVTALADSLNISEALSNLLVQRGINNFYDAKKFFRPSLDFLYDPFLMNGMEEATSRVIRAITENQLIIVYGDYDVDGTCATALLFMFLKELEANVEFYIPQRLVEGYGISKAGIEYIHNRNASLLISVDCGITAIEETDAANKYGIDVIICDHHHPKDQLPEALAILDPIKPCCKYPFKYLSGAGVAFKLAQGISERIGKRDLPFKYLDLVSLAAAADIVSLTDENRILVHEGLKLINSSPRAGIKALIEKCSISPGSLSSGQVVFTLAPRINAVGRLGDAKRAVNLLTTDNLDEAHELASVLETENYERRKIDVDTFDSALELIASTINLKNNIPIILHQEDWHPGVIGIVASRIVEKYYRPTIMLTTVDGIAKGSARSITNFNIYEALQKCEELLIHFGGHQAAAGLAVELEKLEEFKSRFSQIVKDSIDEKDLLPEIVIDSKIKFSELTPKFLRVLELFSPFGPGNMRPVFLAEGVGIVSTPRVVGVNHLIVSLKQNSTNKVFDAVGFNMGEYLDSIKKPDVNFDIVFSIDKLVREGREFPQLKLKDLKIN